MLTWQRLKKTVDDWISHPSKRPFVGAVQAQPGGKTIVVGNAFPVEESYFSIRLVEMGLAEGGRFFVDFLPLGVCLTEYTIGDERQRRPMILSNDLIASQIKDAGAKPGYVEYTNMYAVRCAPVKADNLSLFIGLFRMPYGDLAKQVLQIASDLTQQIGGDANPAAMSMAAGLRAAEKVYDGVSGLFGLKGVTPLFGFADGNALVTSGYLLVCGPSAKEMEAGKLLVIDNRLTIDGKRASGIDYCLVAIEHTSTRLPQGVDSVNSLTGLAFHRRYREASQLLAAKNTAEAEAKIALLRAELVVSPELTENDRTLAIAAYDTSYEKLRKVLAPGAAAVATRSARGASTSSFLRQAADQRRKAGQAVASDVLSQMAKRLQIGINGSDPDALFAAEAAALQQGVGPLKLGANPNLAATVAEAISGALTRS
jgi:hypothetical protein